MRLAILSFRALFITSTIHANGERVHLSAANVDECEMAEGKQDIRAFRRLPTIAIIFIHFQFSHSVKRKAIHQNPNVQQEQGQRDGIVHTLIMIKCFNSTKLYKMLTNGLNATICSYKQNIYLIAVRSLRAANIKIQHKWKFYLENIMPAYKSQMQRSINDYQMHSPEIVQTAHIISIVLMQCSLRSVSLNVK